MFKLLAKLLGVNSPIDKLIKVTGGHVDIWNGINYSKEYMLKYPGGDFLDPKEHPMIKVAFGRYRSGYGDWCSGGDYTSDNMVKFFIDENFVIRNIIRNDPFYNGPRPKRSQERAIDRILQRIKIGDKFETHDANVMQWIKSFFTFPVYLRYRHCLSVEDALNRKCEFSYLKYHLSVNPDDVALINQWEESSIKDAERLVGEPSMGG